MSERWASSEGLALGRWVSHAAGESGVPGVAAGMGVPTMYPMLTDVERSRVQAVRAVFAALAHAARAHAQISQLQAVVAREEADPNGVAPRRVVGGHVQLLPVDDDVALLPAADGVVLADGVVVSVEALAMTVDVQEDLDDGRAAIHEHSLEAVDVVVPL